MSLFSQYYSVIISNPALKSIVLVIASIIAAKLVDIIFTFIFKRLVDKTKTRLDDKILQLLHKPIFYSILFIGFSVAVKTATIDFERVRYLRENGIAGVTTPLKSFHENRQSFAVYK